MQGRIDYERVAGDYDRQPYRVKAPDPDLLEFAAAHLRHRLSVLDAACGTGSQLLANLPLLRRARLVGLDRSREMLRVARTTSPAIGWTCGDLAWLPYPDRAFDYVSCQFAFHHVREKDRALLEVRRVLAPAGMFVLTNLRPEAMPGHWIYRFFPAAWERDCRDFPLIDDLTARLRELGFDPVETRTKALRPRSTLGELLASSRRRSDCSQLTAISDFDHARGVCAIERAIRDSPLHADSPIEFEVCLATIRASRPLPA